MTILKTAGSSLAIMIISILFSVVLTTMLSFLLLSVSDSNHRIAALNNERSELDRLFLPTSSFVMGKLDDDFINGEFSVSTGAALDAIYVFLPYYVGSVEITNGEKIVYSSPFPRGTRFIPKVNNAAIEVISVDHIRKLGPFKNVELSISVLPDGGGLTVLSEIYVGTVQDFITQRQRSYLYYGAPL